MTERKPAFVSFETWVDRQIREAEERGAFDDLAGAGKPLPGMNKPHDENWWIKQRLRDEGLSADALLPAPLQLRKEAERLPDEVRELATEAEVRDVVADLNLRIAAWMRAPTGPRVRIGPVDADEIVRRWRDDRAAARPPAEPAAGPARRRRWWRRGT
ncbi:DUF1992 domain-containing protein [Saccharopolyspora taberi]|uniref:DUF1992 domain-containing protein n=1 Tax=Saccharopolyspora taberi TaxID=60895 RepID=A0ABN3V9I3_9PSEU